jgi:hypothetical protein
MLTFPIAGHVAVAATSGDIITRAEARQHRAERRAQASILGDIRSGRTEANASRRTRRLLARAWRTSYAVDRAYRMAQGRA